MGEQPIKDGRAALVVPTSEGVVSEGGHDHLLGVGAVIIVPVGDPRDPTILQRVEILHRTYSVTLSNTATKNLLIDF